jgi:hypothetical protein
MDIRAMRQRGSDLPDPLPCPFCGRVPDFRFRVDEEPRSTGHIGHYAVRDPCCRVMGGNTELFFTEAGVGPNMDLWETMCRRLIEAWNVRQYLQRREGE